MRTPTQRTPVAARYRLAITAFLTMAAMLALPINATANTIEMSTNAAPPTTATATTASANPVAQMTEVQSAELEAEVARISTHLNDALELDYASAFADDQISRTTLDEFAIGIAAGGGTVIGAGAASQKIESNASRLTDHVESDDAVTLACEGRNGWAAVPPTIYLSSCNAAALSSALAAGAAIATITALIISWTGAGAAVAGVVAAALALYSSVYAICNSWGHGIRIYVVTTLPVCWSQ